MDDEFLDYWEEEPDYRVLGEGWISIYTLPPLAAVIISVVLAALMINFAQVQLAGVNLSTLSIELQVDAGADNRFAGESASVQPRGDPSIAPLFSPSVRYWEAEILEWAREWDLDPNLAATVMQIESCGHPEVSSSAGAVGLFQVMPFHFKAGEDARDPDTNAYRGLSYLSRSLETHAGDTFYALAGYNAGIGGSQRGQPNWPAETQRYTYWGSGIYADAQQGLAQSERLDEWLASGGASLCRRAADFLGINP